MALPVSRVDGEHSPISINEIIVWVSIEVAKETLETTVELTR